MHEKSYTSKTSLLDWDNIPTYNENATEKSVFSGNRSKQVWYKAVDGTLIQADVNGSHNISRKVISTAYFQVKDIVARDRGYLVMHPRQSTLGLFRKKRSNPTNEQARAEARVECLAL